MKIITGQYGGRRFDPPRNLSARPTTDLAKQALFNILQNRMDLEGCRALDLFSGTGSISFELLSRGAAYVVSVELGHTQQQFIQKVAAQLNVPRNRHQLIRGDVFRYLNAPPAMSVGPRPPTWLARPRWHLHPRTRQVLRLLLPSPLPGAPHLRRRPLLLLPASPSLIPPRSLRSPSVLPAFPSQPSMAAQNIPTI